MNQQEINAQVFMRAATALGIAMSLTETLMVSTRQDLASKIAAADTVLIAGADMCSALRTLAMRLDRAAYINLSPSELDDERKVR